MSRPRPPVLIQRELLLNEGAPDPEQIERLVAFQRHGHQVLLVAEQPAGWRPTRRAVDRDLGLQQDMQQRIRRAGAELDGVIYLVTGLFARKRNRLSEIDQLGERYNVSAADLIFIGRETILLESFIQCGGKSISVGPASVPGAKKFDSFKTALESLEG